MSLKKQELCKAAILKFYIDRDVGWGTALVHYPFSLDAVNYYSEYLTYILSKSHWFYSLEAYYRGEKPWQLTEDT